MRDYATIASITVGFGFWMQCNIQEWIKSRFSGCFSFALEGLEVDLCNVIYIDSALAPLAGLCKVTCTYVSVKGYYDKY